MNILPVNKLDFINITQPKQQNKRDFISVSYGLKMQAPLNSDMVSFGAKMKDFFVRTAEKNNKKYLPEAIAWLDTLEALALKHKDKGLSFDRSYCEPHVIKNASDVVGKIERGDEVRDRIRTTLFSKNISDLSVLVNYIIPELSDFRCEIETPVGSQGIIRMLSDPQHYFIADDNKFPLEKAIMRGYKANEEERKKGYVTLPDIDIRLAKVEHVEKLPNNLVYAVGKPQPSGYEDIQIRFARYIWDDKAKKFIRKKGVPLFELIILPGKKYAEAKADESKHIYSYTRQFKQLHLLKYEDNTEVIEPLNICIDAIKTIFSEVSSRIYKNAKNYDMCVFEKELNIKFNDGDETDLTGFYNEIENLTKAFYDKKLKSLNFAKKQKIAEIKRLHHNSQDKLTQEGLKKANVIRNKYNNLTFAINKDYGEDMEKLKAIRDGLTEAYAFYSNYNKKPKDMDFSLETVKTNKPAEPKKTN